MSVCLCSLYLNPITDEGKQALYGRGVTGNQGNNQQVKVLASVTEGSDISGGWHPILRVIQENASSWDHKQVKQQLKVRSPTVKLHKGQSSASSSSSSQDTET